MLLKCYRISAFSSLHRTVILIRFVGLISYVNVVVFLFEAVVGDERQLAASFTKISCSSGSLCVTFVTANMCGTHIGTLSAL